MRRALVAVVALLVVACEPKPCPPVTPTADAGDVDALDAASPTAAACARLVALHCPEGDANTSGETCAAVWQRAITVGALPASGPRCVAAAKDVSAVKACGVRCTP